MVTRRAAQRTIDLPWDDPAWREPDNPWTASCRWLQAWWRTHELHAKPGPISKENSRLVASMLAFDAPPGSNFLSPEIRDAIVARLAEGNHSGIIAKDRLLRNLLSSQPTCFNLFGPFVSRPAALTDWVRWLDPLASQATAVRFEWAPPREEHFDGGSAFDAFIEYVTASGGRRFVGVECKYAEDLQRTSIEVRDVYTSFTNASGNWRAGASTRLNAKHLRQFWLNTLLAESLAMRGNGGYETGLAVVVAAGADRSAAETTDAVRAELADPDSRLKWSSYEDVLARVDGFHDWKDRFTRRYLDLRPVEHLLNR